MKTQIKKVIALSAVAAVLCVCSCKSDIDYNDIDLTIQIGGNSLALPLGSTGKISIGELLKGENNSTSEFFHVGDDGVYEISVGGIIDASSNIPSLESFTTSPQTCEIPVDIALIAYNVDAGVSAEIPLREIPIDSASEPFSLTIPGDISSHIKSADMLLVEGEGAIHNIDIIACPKLSQKATFVGKISLPDFVIVDDPRVSADNSLTVTREFDGSEGRIHLLDPAIKIKGISLKGREIPAAGLTLEGEIKIESKILTQEGTSFISTGGIPYLKINQNFEVGAMQVSEFFGQIDFGSDPVKTNIEISGIPDELSTGKVSLDFVNPHIDLCIKSNLDIPIEATIDLLPYYNESADGSKSCSANITIPKSSEQAETRIRLGQLPEGTPEGMTYVQVDLRKLLSNIPEKIEVTVKAKAGSGAIHHYDFRVQPSFDLEYSFAVPFILGENFRLSYSTDIDLDESTAKTIEDNLARGSKIGIGGAIESSIPMAVDMAVTLIDAEGATIPTEKIGASIAAYDGKGESTPSKFDLIIGGTSVCSLGKIRLDFNMSGTASGLPLKETSAISANLYVSIPGGVTLDLNNLSEDSE